jgi:hypothetical protein
VAQPPAGEAQLVPGVMETGGQARGASVVRMGEKER